MERDHSPSKCKRQRSVSPRPQRLLEAPPQPPQGPPSVEDGSSRPSQLPFTQPAPVPPPSTASRPTYPSYQTSISHPGPPPPPPQRAVIPNPVFGTYQSPYGPGLSWLAHQRQSVRQAPPPPSIHHAPRLAIAPHQSPFFILPSHPVPPPPAPRLPYSSLVLLQPRPPPPPPGPTFPFVPQRSSFLHSASAPGPPPPLPPTMPYNTTAIPPRREATGATQLPLSRVKKIIALDTDINMCSNNAAFVITIATEMFIQYLAEQGHNVVKSERKPRRNIQYRDLSNAVARLDNLEFLADIVPKTVPYKEVKEKKAPAGPAKATNGESSMEHGQTTLDASRPPPPVNGMNGFGHDGANDDGDDSTIADPNQQLEMEIRGARTSTGSIGDVMNGQNKTPRDVEMS